MDTYKKMNPRPVMAVLVSNVSIQCLRNQIVGPRIRLMVEANKEVNNILYYFSLRNVRLKERKITGYYWHSSYKRWLRKEFAFPDILYIRGPIDPRYTQTFKKLSDFIKMNNGNVINQQRFNKWKLYQIMSKDPAMKNYLPVTRTVKHPDDIEKMLQRYKVVYLKSHFGRKGQNVLRVETLSNGSFRYSCFKNDSLTVKTVSEYTTLLEVIKYFFNGRDFLIQQAIKLICLENTVIDMRAELQRNGEGNLEIVGISVRQGGPGSPITTHGRAYKLEDFFEKKMGYTKEKMKTLKCSVHEFLISVYEYIEINYSKYVEIGIDFAIDTNEEIWFIEANSQSTKISLQKAYGNKVLARAYKNILEYARFLFNQSR